MNCYLGVDIGTTNLKAAVFTVEGEMLAFSSAPNINHHPRPDYGEFDMEEIWAGLCKCIREVVDLVGAERIKGVGVSSMAESGVPLDADGNVLYPMIAWYDNRTEPQMEELGRNLGRREIYQITGQNLGPKFGLCKMMWIRENHPEALEQMAHWLSTEDYIIYRLSGEFATDYTMAGRTMAFDVTKLSWSEKMLSQAGVSPEVMPRAYPGGAKVGEVHEKAAGETGLLPGTAVVTGGHDHCCAAVGINIFEDGAVLDSMGTAETLMIATDQLMLNDLSFEKSYTVYPHCGKRLYRVMAPGSGPGVVIDWIFRNLGADLEGKGAQNGTSRYTEMERVIGEKSGRGLWFYPMLRGDLKNAFAGATFRGVRDFHDRGDLIAAAFNGLIYESKQNMDTMHEVFGESFDRCRVVGGVSKSDYIMQKKADIFKNRMEVPINHESACFGAALLAAIGVGELSFDDMGRFYHCDRAFEPRSEEDYEQDYETYLRNRAAVLALYEEE
ncbi:MAG: hypothetical protein IJ744_12595 [Lachnospiraceae bacterium]|nr:hypothetical protein [Lachnospiraceae bacterium]